MIGICKTGLFVPRGMLLGMLLGMFGSLEFGLCGLPADITKFSDSEQMLEKMSAIQEEITLSEQRVSDAVEALRPLLVSEEEGSEEEGSEEVGIEAKGMSDRIRRVIRMAKHNESAAIALLCTILMEIQTGVEEDKLASEEAKDSLFVAIGVLSDNYTWAKNNLKEMTDFIKQSCVKFKDYEAKVEEQQSLIKDQQATIKSITGKLQVCQQACKVLDDLIEMELKALK